MRIALFHNAPSGGAKRAIFEWTRRLAKNHSIDVYTLSTADHKFCDVRPYVTNYNITAFSPRSLYASPFGRLNQFQRYLDLVDLTVLGRQVAKEIESRSYDVVFAHTCQFTTIPTILQFLNTPSVYYLHEPFGRNFRRHLSRPYETQNGLRARIDKYDPLITLYQRKLEILQSYNVNSTTRLIANAEFTKRYMVDKFGLNIPVCNLGVDSASFRPLVEIKRKPFIISVGEMSPRKGFDFIVESVGCIPKKIRPPLKLACNRVDEKELGFIMDLAARREVELEVKYGLDTGDLAVFYNQAQLCLYAPVKEPFGLVPIEAMACGTAVVGVNEGGVKESVIHRFNGLLVDRDPEQFSNAIQYLLQEPQIAREYGENGRDYVQEHWTWERSTAAIAQQLTICAEIG